MITLNIRQLLRPSVRFLIPAFLPLIVVSTSSQAALVIIDDFSINGYMTENNYLQGTSAYRNDSGVGTLAADRTVGIDLVTTNPASQGFNPPNLPYARWTGGNQMDVNTAVTHGGSVFNAYKRNLGVLEYSGFSAFSADDQIGVLSLDVVSAGVAVPVTVVFGDSSGGQAEWSGSFAEGGATSSLDVALNDAAWNLTGGFDWTDIDLMQFSFQIAAPGTTSEGIRFDDFSLETGLAAVSVPPVLPLYLALLGLLALKVRRKVEVRAWVQ